MAYASLLLLKLQWSTLKKCILLIAVEGSMISWSHCIWACSKTVVDPETVLQLVQKWLAINRKFKNSEVAQSTRMDVLAGL